MNNNVLVRNGKVRTWKTTSMKIVYFMTLYDKHNINKTVYPLPPSGSGGIIKSLKKSSEFSVNRREKLMKGSVFYLLKLIQINIYFPTMMMMMGFLMSLTTPWYHMDSFKHYKCTFIAIDMDLSLSIACCFYWTKICF